MAADGAWRAHCFFQGVPRSLSRKTVTLGLCLIAFAAAYGNVIVRLVHDWANDGNYTHGFVLVPIAVFLVYRQWPVLRRLPGEPSASGLFLVTAALAQLVTGSIAAEQFMMRTSLVLFLAGTVVFLWGWRHLRATGFPFALLLLTIPLPAIIFNEIAFPLQLLASRVGVDVLQVSGVPALREGNVIVLAHTQLEVAEACSGLRSLVSLFSLGLLYAYFSPANAWGRIVITLLTIPIAILTNALRVAGTGVAAHWYGPEAATGLLHTFSGWLVFTASLAIFMAAGAVVARVASNREPLPS